MKKVATILIAMTLTALTAAAHPNAAQTRPTRPAAQPHPFPEIPTTLKTPQERATWLTLHFWDGFDFGADHRQGSAAEQAFVDFISVLPMSSERRKAMDTFMKKAARNPELLRYFMELADKYLYEPMSPMRDDALYMEFLKNAARKAPKAEKRRLRWQMERLKMNAVGKKAQDFEYMDGTAAKTLMKTEGEYIMIFFHDPYCRDCRRMKNELANSAQVREMTENGRMKIISISIEDEDKMLYYSNLYDLRTFPALYLLDTKKRVLLKNASVKDVENIL